MPPPETGSPSEPRRKRWYRRKRLYCALVFVMLPGVALIVVTRTALLVGLVLDAIEQTTGCEAHAESVRLAWDGAIVLEDLRLDAPDVQGPAGQVLLAPRVVVRVDWRTALTGKPEVTHLRVIRPLLRIYQHTETGVMNIAGLGSQDSSQAYLKVPTFDVVDGRVELGEHSDSWSAPLSDLRVDGSGSEDPRDPGAYTYTFTELDAEGRPDPGSTIVKGRIDFETGAISAELVGLDLADWSRRTLPSSYQPFWETLALRGTVPGARLTYAVETGVTIEIDVRQVTMSLPFDLREEEGRQLVELSDVDGSIGFSEEGPYLDVAGMVEDVPVTIDLRGDSFNADTALTADVSIRRYRLEEEPTLLPVAPRLADVILQRFGMPTGLLDVDLSLERGAPTAPGIPGAWSYAGAIEISDGLAAFEQFPYPVRDISASLRFDQSRFEVVRFTGVGERGARLNASGTIVPPGDGAEVDIRVIVEHVPLTDTFRQAMPASRRPIYNVLFDTKEHRRLLEAGVFRPSGSPDDGTPVFDLAGRADLDIRVFRPEGTASSYTTTIGVSIAEAGIVPVGLPYPVIAQDVRLTITPTRADIEQAELHGLTGMHGTIEGSVVMEDGLFAPDLTIHAEQMPIDRTLALALPDAGVGAGDAVSPRRAMLELGVQGTLDGRAHIALDPSGRMGFVVDAELDSVSSTDRAPLRFERVSGALRITRDSFDATGLRGEISGSRFMGDVGVVFARPLDGVEPMLNGRFVATSIDLEAPFEDLAGRFDDASAGVLRDLRERLEPAGLVDADLSFSVAGGEALEYRLAIEPRSDVTMIIAGDRWVAHQPDGALTVTPGVATFENFSAAIGVEGEERFTASLDGTLPFAAPDPSGRLLVEAAGVRLRTRTVERALLDRFEPVRRALGALGVDDAVFDVRAALAFDQGTIDAEWELTPDAIDLVRQGVRSALDADGRLIGHNGAVRAEGLVLTAPTWTLEIEGERGEDGSGRFELELSADAVDDSLLALLPGHAADALRAIEFQTAGTLALEGATLTLSPDAPPALSGALRYERASARVGAPIGDASGIGRFDGSADAFDLTLHSDGMRFARVRVEDLELRVLRRGSGRDIEIPVIHGRVHGGLVAANAVLRTSRSDITYELDAQLVGARFGDVLHDLDATEKDATTDRGTMDAGLSLHGSLGRATDRRGRATVRVQDGRVLDLPGIIPLLELSNLQAPSNERVDLGYLDLFVAGDRALVDRMTLYSDSLQIAGTGSVDLSTLGIDLAISTQGAHYVPILTPLLEGLREEIASTRVTGTLVDPIFRTEQFRNTRALLDAITGTPSPDERRARSDTR